jgi:hypothetical protein
VHRWLLFAATELEQPLWRITLDEFPSLRAYMQRMYARPKAPLRIAEAFRRIRG